MHLSCSCYYHRVNFLFCLTLDRFSGLEVGYLIMLPHTHWPTYVFLWLFLFRSSLGESLDGVKGSFNYSWRKHQEKVVLVCCKFYFHAYIIALFRPWTQHIFWLSLIGEYGKQLTKYSNKSIFWARTWGWFGWCSSFWATKSGLLGLPQATLWGCCWPQLVVYCSGRQQQGRRSHCWWWCQRLL